ncbi:MAG: formate dehydrogenase accessory sulfurtransferase FdhD [Chloroflexota bacterium]|nr:formate dehydrogenase accessory sulfurtransferase FdhD [Chloroflexota bacterium]
MTLSSPRTSKTRVRVWTVDGEETRQHADQLATEEPLEIRLLAGGEQRTVAVTMRTPGADFELAAGFLFGEGIIGGREEIRRMTYCVDPEVDAEQRYNIVNVALRNTVLPDLATLERHFMTTSACGVCGKASLDALHLRGQIAAPPGPEVSAALITSLPDRLRAGQGLFDVTGGLHAAGLFDCTGNLLAVREDVGRHNALDKLIGWALLDGTLPLHEHILLVSGRVSFELVQKALAAGIPIICAISAPSSLAVSLAAEFGMTLIGFLRGERFNIYTGPNRVRTTEAQRTRRNAEGERR